MALRIDLALCRASLGTRVPEPLLRRQPPAASSRYANLGREGMHEKGSTAMGSFVEMGMLCSHTMGKQTQNLMPNIQEWEKAVSVPDSIYQQAARDGLLMPIAAGPSIPSVWKQKYPIIGDIPADEWDGFHDLIVHDEIGRVGSIG